MRNELFRSNDLWFFGGGQVLQASITRNQEVASVCTAENEDVIRVHQAISQSSHSREQLFGLCKIDWQHTQVVSDAFELRLPSVGGKKQFLEHYRVNGKANSSRRFGRKQFSGYRLALEVIEDNVCVQKNERPHLDGMFALFRPGLSYSFHFSIVSECGR